MRNLIPTKNIYRIMFLAILLISTGYTFRDDDKIVVKRGKLHIQIIGFANDNGDCWFALDDSKETYESENFAFIPKILPIVDGKVFLTIDSLEYEDYAIRVFHDENGNGELDTNFLGVPTEDYGYSNNVSGWFGPPSWERARFLFNQKEMTVKIFVD